MIVIVALLSIVLSGCGVSSNLESDTVARVRSNHGIGVGGVTLKSGASEEHGKVVIACPADGPDCVLTIGGDGSVRYENNGGQPSFVLARPKRLPEIPRQSPLRSTHAAILDLNGTLHVGADVAPPANQLVEAGEYDGISVSSGRVRDGVGGSEVVAYLNQVMNVSVYKRVPGLETFSSQPTVRIAEGTSDQLTDYAVRAVQLINGALPREQRILIGEDAAPARAAIGDVPDGEIFIDFARWNDWNTPGKPARAGAAAGICECAKIYHFDEAARQQTVKERRAAHVWIERDIILTARVFDPETMRWETQILDSHGIDSDTVRMQYPAQGVIAILVHELLHAMGMTHLDPMRFPRSMMSNAGSEEDPDGVTGHVLYPVDREALQAAYSAFLPGSLPGDLQDSETSGVLGGLDDPVSTTIAFGDNAFSGLSAADLGPWDDTSFHVRGALYVPGGPVSFGVASRNGLAQAWASGPTPWTDLADNPLLPDTATWSGRMLGATPAAETVSGAAKLTVDLESRSGELVFTALENWGVYEAPGTVGSGVTWGDGDLRYTVAVRGNTFAQTGGDEGMVTGLFFGHAHEGMGGALDRTDLTASFGGMK